MTKDDTENTSSGSQQDAVSKRIRDSLKDAEKTGARTKTKDAKKSRTRADLDDELFDNVPL